MAIKRVINIHQLGADADDGLILLSRREVEVVCKYAGHHVAELSGDWFVLLKIKVEKQRPPQQCGSYA